MSSLKINLRDLAIARHSKLQGQRNAQIKSGRLISYISLHPLKSRKTDSLNLRANVSARYLLSKLLYICISFYLYNVSLLHLRSITDLARIINVNDTQLSDVR